MVSDVVTRDTSGSERAIMGCIWGTAVGDALGLAYEGLTPHRQQRLYPDIGRYHLLFGHGMISDDTEHTWMVARALLLSEGDAERFGRAMAWQLRLWLLALPGGIGLATLRATLKLCIGIPPTHSGVFSAGNGPAMRSALLGVCFGTGTDHAQLKALVRINTRITHTDPKAEYGAFVIALAGGIAASRDGESSGQPIEIDAVVAQLTGALPAEAEELADLLERVRQSVGKGEDTATFAEALTGCTGREFRGVSGYVYQTVPVVVHAWLSFPNDYERAVLAVIRCGGDTDTTAAIVGALVGASVGKKGIPPEWRAGLSEWPRTPARMEALGKSLANTLDRVKASNSFSISPGQKYRETPISSVPVSSVPVSSVPVSSVPVSSVPVAIEVRQAPGVPMLNPVSVLVRNLFFILVILFHGFRRLLPPY